MSEKSLGRGREKKIPHPANRTGISGLDSKRKKGTAGATTREKGVHREGEHRRISSKVIGRGKK